MNNNVEALLTVGILLLALTVMLMDLQEVISLIDQPDGYFGVSGSGGIIYKPHGIGFLVSIVGVLIGIMMTFYSAEYLVKRSTLPPLLSIDIVDTCWFDGHVHV